MKTPSSLLQDRTIMRKSYISKYLATLNPIEDALVALTDRLQEKISSKVKSDIISILERETATDETKLDSASLKKALITNQESLDNFHYSILAGEYYDSKLFDTELTSINNQIKNLLNRVKEVLKQENWIVETLLSPLKEFELTIENVILRIIFHSVYIGRRVESRMLDEKILILNKSLDNELNEITLILSEVIDKKKREIGNQIKLKTLHSYYFFLINIKLAEIDESHFCDIKTIEILLGLDSSIKFLQDHGIISFRGLVAITTEKARFLISKINKRNIIVNEDNANSIRYKPREYEIIGLDIIRPYKYQVDKSSSSYFKIFEEKSTEFYTQKATTFLLNENNLIRFSNLSNSLSKKELLPRIEDYHFFCKIIQKNCGLITAGINNPFASTVDILKNHALFLESWLNKTSKYVFNYYAYESAFYLVLVTQLKLKGNQIIANNMSFYSLRSEYYNFKNLYTSLTQKTRADSPCFSLHRYFCKFSVKIIKKIEDQIDSIDSDELNDLESFIQDIFFNYYNSNNDFVTSLEESEHLGLHSLYLTKEECILTSTGEPNLDRIFLDSGYVLPTNYEVLKSEEERARMKIYDIESLIFHKIMIKQFSNQLDKVDLKIKENQVNATQIIGLYAGFVTFTLGSVSIIPKFEGSISAIFAFLFVFATGLGVFALLLRGLIRPKNDMINFRKMANSKDGFEINSSMVMSILVLLLFLVSLFLVFYFKGDGIQTRTVKYNKSEKHSFYDKTGKLINTDSLSTQIDTLDK